MRAAAKWLAVIVICFAVPAVMMESLFVAFPEAFQEDTEIPLKFILYLVGVQLTVTLAALLEWRVERQSTLAHIRSSILDEVEQRVEEGMQRGIVGHFIGSKGGSALSTIFGSVADSLLRRLRDKPADLLEACSPLIESELALALRHVDDSLGAGAKVTIADHLKVTRYLCEHSASYLQIQRRAFAVPDEWTADWMKFVEDSKSSGASRRYVVLLTPEEMSRDARKIDSMRDFLVARGFEFGTCNFVSVVDSTGGIAPPGVIELFGNGVIKMAELPEGKYHGGAKLTMVITDGSRRPDVLRFAELVEKFADFNGGG